MHQKTFCSWKFHLGKWIMDSANRSSVKSKVQLNFEIRTHIFNACSL